MFQPPCFPFSPNPSRRPDDNPQFVVIRDPRAVAVSTYFWIQTHLRDDLIRDHHPAINQTLDEAVLDILESVCRWTTIRDMVFNGYLSHNSTIFWYEDAQANPLEWHYRWTHMAGLLLPATWVENISELAANGTWSPLTIDINEHPGGLPPSPNRTWQQEVSPEKRNDMDGVLRQWLSPVLLARFGVSPVSQFGPEN